MKKAIATVLVCLAGGMSMGFANTPLTSTALQAVIVGSTVLGTMYSLEPIRLKR